MKNLCSRISVNHQRPGAALLVFVLIVGAVSILIGATLASRSISYISMGNADIQSRKVLAQADGCIEDVLLRLRNNRQYAGGTLTRSDGTCVVTLAGAMDSKQVTIQSTISRWSTTVVITVNLITPRISILDWRTQ